MRKLQSLFMVMVLVVGCFTLVACGGGDDDEGDGTSQQVTQTDQDGGDNSSSSEGCTDVPRYPGADDVEKASWNWGAGQFGAYAAAEWHYYTTDDDAADVIDYYLDKMPDEGWQETMSFDYPDYSMAMWMRDDGDTIAGVGTGDYGDGDTGIVVWCGSGLDDMSSLEDEEEGISEDEGTSSDEDMADIGDFTWDDVPTYPGADEEQSFSMNLPSDEADEFETVKWRYFTTDDSIEEVGSFYANEMLDNGWEEMYSMNLPMFMSYWQKHDGAVGAWISVMDGDGETIISMWRGQ